MKYSWNFWTLFIFHLFLVQGLSAQTVYIEYTEDEGMTSVCAWESVRLFRRPGESALVGSVLFGEELTHVGQEALVKEEKRNYLLVKTAEGKIGWINEVFLVKDAGLVVVLERTRLYENPASFSSAKDDFFKAGELAILSNYQDDWIFLVGKEKSKSGWIKGYDILSVDPEDVAIASMLQKARAKENPEEQIASMKSIGQVRGFVESPLAPIIKNEISRISRRERDDRTEGERYLSEAEEFRPNGEDDLAKDIFDRGDSRGPNANELNRLDRLAEGSNVIERRKDYLLETQEVVDFASNRSLIRFRETGTIAPVKAKNPPNMYYAYHKDLAKGSKVLLEVPGTDSYVELTIVAPLRKDNPNMIGLGSEVLEAVYGESQAKNVPYATIIYYKE